MPCWTPQVCHTTPKMVPPYSLGTCPPKTPKPCRSFVTPSSRKNWFSEGIFFWQTTRMALESPKIDICQNWPRRVQGDVISCLESKFDQKIPMGSVPNCRKEIPNRYGIRWFKCKLKPPKNSMDSFLEVTRISRSLLSFERNLIRLGGPAHGIVTKTVHKTLPRGGGGQGVGEW